MTDPYEILGVAPSASDDEIKTAYRNLAKKYHPDNYGDAPDIADLASQKMRDINEAYDMIVKERKNGGSTGEAAHSAGNAQQSASSARTGAKKPQYKNAYSTTTNFPDVRRLIMNSRFDDANAVLDGVPMERRDAEWNFLKGTVLYRRGWLEQAYTYFEASVSMEPNNSEFRAAYNQASRMRSGNSGGYKMRGDRSGCNPCSACCSLLCADQCCECFGGDLISCC